jgi:putative ABC transport system permease protein
MSAWLREIRFGARVLWRNRTATIVAFITLTLAIGATTGIFTVVDATLVRALPYPEPDRLVRVARGYPTINFGSVAPIKFLYWRQRSDAVYSHLAAYDALGAGFNLVGVGAPERLIGSRVSAAFFGAMGVRPVVGRDFRPEEDLPGHGKVVVLSYDVWQHRFDGRTDLIGQAITLNGEPYTVIGVMPEDFRYPETVRLWTLFQVDPATQDAGNFFEVVGRLRPGVSVAQAKSAMEPIAAAFRRAHPDLMDKNEIIGVEPLRERLYGNLRPALLVLLAAVGFVLLIACVNVANLQIAQASGRSHEMALRAALGAKTWDVVRQLLLESLLLATASGIAGIALAYWSVPLLLARSPIDPAEAAGIGVDLRVLVVGLTLSLLCGILFGLLPAWQAARPDIDQVLRANAGRTMSSASGGRLRRVLIAGEVALALMLTIGAFLLVKSLAGLRATDPGFTVERVLTMKLSLPEGKYAAGDALARFQEQVEERIGQIPGVHGVALALSLPMEMGMDLPFTIEGKYVPGTQKGVADTLYRASGPGYFQALQIPLRRGRLFDARDRRSAVPVAVINEAAARELWPGEDPIGRHISLGQPMLREIADPLPREIIGIVGDVRETGLQERPQPILYIPLAQQNTALNGVVKLIPFSIIVRGEGTVANLTRATQQAIWSVDPAQPIADVRLMREIVSRALGSQTFNTALLGSLAGLALLLAAVGLYGVISHIVGQRTREIGIRMALGATQARVLSHFVRQALLLVAVGIVIGIGGALGLTRFLRSMLTDISTTDPWVFALAPALLLAIALLAALTPALRAARTDPSSALRAD